jgi:hypothetical protein
MVKKREPQTYDAGETVEEKPSKSRAVAEVYDWRKEIAGYAAKTLKMEESVSVGNRVSTRGGVLSYKQTPLKDNQLNCIILTALIENAYYAGEFDPDNPRAPVCFAFSTDGEDMEPHEKSHEKQNDTCKGCQGDAFGSASKGRGKACKNIRRIALLPLEWPFTAKDVEESEIATLSVPVMSVKGYSAYVKDLALKSNLPPWAWVTTVGCAPDPKSQYRVTFQSADRKPLPDKMYNAILARVKEAEKVIDEPYVYVDASTVERPAQRNGGRSATTRRSKY